MDTLFNIPPSESPSAKRLREAKEKWRIWTQHFTKDHEFWYAALIPESVKMENAGAYFSTNWPDLYRSDRLEEGHTELEAVLKLCRLNKIEVRL